MDSGGAMGGLPPEAAPSATSPEGPGPGLGTKVFIAIVILGFLAAGAGAIKTYVDQSRRAANLREHGVATDADVMSVTEISGRRIETYHELRVSYDPAGPKILEFAEVQDCAGARYETGVPTVRVVYLPNDPETIRLESCRSSFDSDVLPGILGLVFLTIALSMLWRVRRLWTS